MNPSEALRAELLTPPGAGAIAVVRVAGPMADQIVDKLFHPARGSGLRSTSVGRLRYGVLRQGDETIDDIIACVVVRDEACCAIDLCMHGGVRVVDRALEALAAQGVAVDDQREEGGRVEGGTGVCGSTDNVWGARNLIELEADAALAAAATRRTVAFLATQRLQLPQRLRDLISLARDDPRRALDELRAMAATVPHANRLIKGVAIVLVGPPNSGKSTLFNRLAGRAVAIESPIEGTTRDWVSADIELDGVPVTLVDTAGRHDTPDNLERLAIQMGMEKGRTADLLLVVEDVTRQPSEAATTKVRPSASEVPSTSPPVIVIRNKADLFTSEKGRGGRDSVDVKRQERGPLISALTGEGFDELFAQIKDSLRTDLPVAGVPSLFTERQTEIAMGVPTHLITDNRTISIALRKLLGEFEETGEFDAYDGVGD